MVVLRLDYVVYAHQRSFSLYLAALRAVAGMLARQLEVFPPRRHPTALLPYGSGSSFPPTYHLMIQSHMKDVAFVNFYGHVKGSIVPAQAMGLKDRASDDQLKRLTASGSFKVCAIVSETVPRLMID